MEFYWYKTGKITSPYNNVTEGWLDDWMEPRSRAFMVKLLEEKSALTIDDLYDYDENDEPRDTEMRLKLQVARLQAKLNALQKEREAAEAEPTGPLLPQYA